MENSFLKKLEFRAKYLYKNNYKQYAYTDYNILLIDEIISNDKTHLVAIFKDYLIYDEFDEFLRRFYKSNEIKERINKLCYYHIQTSVIFPNYFPLVESKYIYNNVVQKQRIINEQEENEENKIKNKKKEKKIDKLFTSTIYDEILDGSDSVMRIVFGIENKKYNLKKYQKEKEKENENNSNKNNDDINKENSLDTNKDSFEINDLIKEFDKAEKKLNLNNQKNKNLSEYTLNNKNKKLNPKIKLLINNTNENKTKIKNINLFYSNTFSSSNFTNSSTKNIKTNFGSKIKTNRNNPNLNINTKDDLLLKFQIENNTINTVKKNKEKINNLYFNKIKNSDSKKNNPTPYKALHGLNFIFKNPLINNLIKTNLINKKQNKNKINNDYNYNNKIYNKESSYINNILNFNSIKNKNIVPKIDISKLHTNNNILTITNRNESRNKNQIYNWISKTVSKSYRKNKIIIRNVIPKYPFSPPNKNGKNIFRKNNNIKFIYRTNNNFIKSLSCKKQNKEYKNVKDKNLEIKDYKFKKKTYLNINFD